MFRLCLLLGIAFAYLPLHGTKSQLITFYASNYTNHGNTIKIILTMEINQETHKQMGMFEEEKVIAVGTLKTTTEMVSENTSNFPKGCSGHSNRL